VKSQFKTDLSSMFLNVHSCANIPLKDRSKEKCRYWT